ncbi:Ig-like domain-containing protein [Geothrix sp. SG200]|uniref:Ig-like domain-containing protein n=1 Tax=Geothrix sp. SG200 TaxID=2922865 RepID=UPI001FAB3AF6|nr:Ig-like domain-containing protein [Geothrix sp. SG200]
MKTDRTRSMLLAGSLLAVAAFTALSVGCSSKSKSPAPAPTPADTTPPTVTLSGTSASAVSAPITVTFTFSESVGTSFTLGDVVVTNGTAATSLVRVDPTHYTLLVSPTPDSSGTMDISVPAGSFSDLAGNLNTAATATSQAFNTVSVPVQYAVLDFNTAGLTYKATDFGGTVSTFPASAPPAGGPSTPVLQVNKTAGSQFWAGTTLSVGYLDSVGAIPFSSLHTKLTAVVYAPVAGASIKLKVEDASNGGHSVESDATATLGWQTLTFDMALPSAGTNPLDFSYTYNKVSLFPNFGDVPGSDQVFFVGPVCFLGTSQPSAPPLASPVAVAPTDAPTAPTQPAAQVLSLYNSSATYTNVPVDNWNPNWGQGGSITDTTINGMTLKLMNLVNYQGVAISSNGGDPGGTGVLNITGRNILHLSYWTADGTNLQIFPINASAEYGIDAGTLTQGGWTDLDIAIDQPGFDLTTIRQLKFVASAPGQFYLDNIYFHAPTVPTTLPPAPSLAAASVISLLNSSGTYTNIAVGDWNPNWGQGGSISDATVAGKTIKLMNLVNYQGINVSPTGGVAGALDITGKNTLHISYWTPDGASINVYPINAATEYAIPSGPLTQGAWADLEIPITQSGFDLTTIRQLKFDTTSGGRFYLDNIYFH